GRSAPRGTLRPDVERRAHADGASAAELAGVRQEECGDIYGVPQRTRGACGCSRSTNLTFHLRERTSVKNMTVLKYQKEIVALLVIDPYNDLISEGGKFCPHLKTVAEENNCVPNMLRVLNAARGAKLRAFYPMHRRYRPG